MSVLDVGWWMNAGFSSARIAAYFSTVRWYCAVRGSRGAKASRAMFRANSQSAVALGHGE